MISVIIPVFNASGYLAGTIDSVKAQTYPDFEVILVDDGSDDGSDKICDKFASEDSRFSVIHKENQGAYSARIAGLDVARGEWVCFVDSDDFLHPEALETLSQGIRDGVSLVTADFRYGLPEEGNPFVGCRFLNEETPLGIISGVDCLRRLFSRDLKEAVWGMTLWNKLYRKDLANSSRMKPYMVSEDVFFNFGVYMDTEMVSYVERVTYSYTQRPSSLSHTKIGEIALVQLAVYYDLYSGLSGHTGDHMEDIEGMLLAKLYRKLLTSRYHVGSDGHLCGEWKDMYRTVTRSTMGRYLHNPFIPMKEKAFFSLSRVFPFLVRLFMKAKGN